MMIRTGSRRWAVAALVAAALGGGVFGQSHPTTFFALPDSNLAAGSECMITGTVAGHAQPVAFDFVEFLNDDRGAYVSVIPDPVITPLKHVVDFRFISRDPSTGDVLEFLPAPGGTAVWNMGSPSGDFLAGWPVTLTLDVVPVCSNPALAALLPATTTLNLAGVVVPGFYHLVTYMSGTLTGLPGLSVTMLLKEDKFDPGVPWEFTARESTSTFAAPGGAVPVRGGLTLVRDAVDFRTYALRDVSLSPIGGGPAFTTAPGIATGSIFLDPAVHSITGTLSGSLGGVPFTHLLDGIGDVFEGPMSHPTRIVVQESNFAGNGPVRFDLDLTTLRASATPWRIGQTTTLTMTGRTGTWGIVAAALDPSPGVNTPVGDVMLDLDPLLLYSLDPTNGLFTSNIAPMPPDGRMNAFVFVPAQPALVGATFFVGGATLMNGAATAVTQSVRAIIVP